MVDLHIKRGNMKLYAPKYYKDFVCIADRCRHSCCIGWEIDVDSDTLEKYAALTEGYGKRIWESIEDMDGCPHFALSEDERCPHLDERGLCRIICEMGEGYLCDICREHPRFYNRSSKGLEAGLGLCCEEACRIILSSDEYAEMILLGEEEGEECFSDFDSSAFRNEIYSVLSDKKIPYAERIKLIYEKFGVSPASVDDSRWREVLSFVELLCEEHRDLFSLYSSDIETPSETENILERALAYFVYRHTGAAEDEQELHASLGFALFCERLLASIAKGGTDIYEAARIISEELEYSEDNTDAVKEEFLF